jgi:hypothetical protein
LAIAMIATGAFLPDLRTKTIFICTITAATAITGWRFLLDRGERSQVLDRLPTMFGFAAGKTSN